MARGNEGAFIDKIHRQLCKNVYKMKMNMGMGAPKGVPDMYYEGSKGMLWIEYKFSPTLLSKVRRLPFKLSEHQLHWRARALCNNINHWVVIGDGTGASITVKGNSKHVALSPKEVAEEIESMVINKSKSEDMQEALEEIEALIHLRHPNGNDLIQRHCNGTTIIIQFNYSHIKITNPKTALQDAIFFLENEYGSN